MDLLRVLAALAVVGIHVSAEVMGIKGLGRSSWWTADFFHAASVWAVPVFVLISGGLLLSSDRREPPGEFLARRARRLLIPLAFWSAVYLVVRVRAGEIHLSEIWLYLLYGQPSAHLWYLYMIVGLYLITPLLRDYLANSTPAGRTYFVLLAFALALAAAAARAFLNLPDPIAPVNFLPFIGYYLAGRMLSSSGAPSVKTHLPVLVIVAAVIITALGTGWLAGRHVSGWKFFCDPLSPTMIAAAIAIYTLFARDPGVRRRLNQPAFSLPARLGPYTLGVYCLHPLWLRAFDRLIGMETMRSFTLIKIPALALAVYILSALAVWLIARVPYLRRVVG